MDAPEQTAQQQRVHVHTLLGLGARGNPRAALRMEIGDTAACDYRCVFCMGSG